MLPSTIPLRFGHTLSVLKTNTNDNNNTNDQYKLYIFGGSIVKDNELTFTNELFEIDMSNRSESWNKISPIIVENNVDNNNNTVIVKERNFHSSVIYENELIIFGGKSNGYFNDMYSFNLIKKDEWKKIEYNNKMTSDIPTPRFGQTMCVYNDNLYLFGGFTNDSEVSNELFQFNLKEKTWKLLKIFNKDFIVKGRYYHTMNIIENKIYIFGGLGESNSVLNDIVMFDLPSINNNNEITVTNIVTNLIDKRIARYGHCSVYFNNKLLFIGGCNKEIDFFFNHFEFDLISNQFKERNDLQFFTKQLESNNLQNTLQQNNLIEFTTTNTSFPVFSTIVLLNNNNYNEDNLLFYSYGGKLNKSKSIPLFDLQYFIEKLNNDEKKMILKFLDIPSLCNLNCVSKEFSLSQLSNDDLFWKDRFTKVIEEYFKPSNNSYYYNNSYTKENEEKKNKMLQSVTKDYKKEILNFVGDVFKKAETVQKERLSNMKFDKDIYLIDKEELLQNQSTILSDITCGLPISIKMVCIGDGACGKTCLLLVLSGSYPNIKNIDYIPTVFDNYNMNVVFEEHKLLYSLGLWDTAGPEDYDRLRPLSYPCTDIFLVCFSIANPCSFENITNKWIPEVGHHCPNVPVLLCGTKVDLRENKKSLFNLTKSGRVPISKEEGIAKAKEVGAIGYIETSSLEATGFDSLSKFIVLLTQIGKKELKKLKKGNKEKCFVQ
ncbi:hypothetical protein ABK040_016655 [Willaertia magna]